MFEQSKQKIERANHHISDLTVYINEILCKSLFVLSIEDNPATGRPGVVCRLCDIKSEIPLILGDAVHNLRSALDILFCDIFRHEELAITKQTMWPFRKTKEELITALNSRFGQKHLNSGIVDLIVNSIQTYRGGKGDALYRLHDLDIEDKHKILLPTITINEIVGISYLNQNGSVGNCRFGFGGQMGWAKDVSFRADGDSPVVEITNSGTAIINVLFGEGPFVGQPIVPVLHCLSWHVRALVAMIEDYFESSAK
jgi:hypothetical protein